MGTPRQIEESAKKSEELHKQVYGGGEHPDGGDADPERKADPKPEEQAAAPNPEPAPKDDPGADFHIPEDRQNDAPYLLARLRTIGGMQKTGSARIAALESKLNELSGANANLTKLLASMSSAPANNAPSNAGPGPETRDGERRQKIDPEQFGEFGDEFKTMASTVNDVAEQADSLKKDQDALRRENFEIKKERFIEGLRKQFPEFDEIDNLPEFAAWLNETDPVYDAPRAALLHNAFLVKWNAPRVIAIYRQWMAETGFVPRGRQPQPDRDKGKEDQPKPEDRKRGLERFVAPGASAPSGESPGGGKTWSPAKIGKFYKDVATGKYKDNPEEKDRLERDIFAAQNEGRIVA